MFNSGSSHEEISKILWQYTDDIKNASMVINKYLRKKEFIVFDLRCFTILFANSRSEYCWLLGFYVGLTRLLVCS